MGLWDFLKPNNNNNGNGLFSQIFNRNNMQQAKPELEPIQLDTVTGEKDPILTAQTELARQQQTKPLNLGDRLLGRDLTMDVQKINPETGETELTTVVNSRPGFFTDMTNGMNENFNNEFKPENWRGQNRGFAYRLGEGLGSVARGLSGWAGDAWTAGYNGLDAGLGRQAIRTGDQLYRKQLKDDYGYTDEDLNNVKGYIDKDTFNNITKSNYNMMRAQNQLAIAMQKDNTSRARLILQGLNNGTITPEAASAMIQNYGITDADFQESNATRNTNINEYLAPHRANMYDNSSLVGLGNLGLKQSEHDMKLKETAAKIKALEDLTGGGNNIIPDDKKRKGRAF